MPGLRCSSRGLRAQFRACVFKGVEFCFQGFLNVRLQAHDANDLSAAGTQKNRLGSWRRTIDVFDSINIASGSTAYIYEEEEAQVVFVWCSAPPYKASSTPRYEFPTHTYIGFGGFTRDCVGAADQYDPMGQE